MAGGAPRRSRSKSPAPKASKSPAPKASKSPAPKASKSPAPKASKSPAPKKGGKSCSHKGGDCNHKGGAKGRKLEKEKKTSLYKKAKKYSIKGRSTMSKAKLAAAIRAHHKKVGSAIAKRGKK